MEGNCLVCQCPLSGDLVFCAKCETPHHRDCWEYVKNCAVYACNGGRRDLRPPVRSEPRPTPVGFAGFGPLLGLSAILMILLFGNFFVHSILEADCKVGSGEIVVNADSYDGEYRVYTEGWSYLPGPWTVHYMKSRWFNFQGIRVKFSDDVVGYLSGTIFYEMPASSRVVLDLHNFYYSQNKMESMLIKDVLAEAARSAARMFTSGEASSLRQREFAEVIKRQVSNGIYSITDSSGRPIFRKPSLLKAFGFRVNGMTLSEVRYY